MTDTIATDAQRLSQDPKVELFELDARSFGGEILRFTSTSNGGEPLFLGGKKFLPVPIEADGFEWSSSGTLPRPTLSMGVQDLSFLSLVVSTEGLHGCPVRRIRTYRKYLDDGSHPNPTATYPIDHFEIDKKKSESKNQVVFELSPKSDREGKQIPALLVLRDTCLHRYRYWDAERGQFDYQGVTCPYADDRMYDANDELTEDPEREACGHRLSSCAKRFGENAVLPTWSFPGVGRI